MNQMTKPPKIISEAEVPTFGPGYDEEHYISVPIKQFISLKNIGNVGVCLMEPGDETVVFAIEAVDDGTAPHQNGPCDKFYYILEVEFTLWCGKDADDLHHTAVLQPGDCTHYPTGWKYKVKNTGDVSAKFVYFLTSPPGIVRRFD